MVRVRIKLASDARLAIFEPKPMNERVAEDMTRHIDLHLGLQVELQGWDCRGLTSKQSLAHGVANKLAMNWLKCW